MRRTINAFHAVGEFLGSKLSKITYLTGLIFSIAVTSSVGFAASGYFLDPTFGDLGRSITSPDGSTAAAAYGMALQSDGKIIMVGSSGANPGLFVARYNTNGNLDTTFGNNGWTTAAFESGGYAYAVDIQPDGKIVVGGSARINNNDDFAIARFNPDGTLDTSFDGDGKTTVSFNDIIPSGSAYREQLSALKVASDGKIIVAGSALNSGVDDRFLFARLEANGTIDASFGTSGRIVDQAYSSNMDRITDMIALPDGKFIVTARLHTVCCSFRMAIKFNVNGSKEWTYQQGLTEFGNYNGFYGIAALPDGKFIATGNRNARMVAQRLNADGTEDASFNGSTTISGQALSVAVRSNGKIVANWMPSNGWADSRNSFNLIGFNADGTLDADFASGGIINAGATAGLDYGQKVFIQPDGKILIGGYSILSSPTRYYFSMMRYRANTTVNNPQFDYDGDGKADISVYRPSNGGWYLNQSTNGFLGVQFGISTDRIVPADYDGDGKTDLAIYRDGVWWIYQSINNSVRTYQFGLAEDIPQTGDFDGDGKDDLVVFRPSTRVWYILKSSDFKFYGTQFGLVWDIPQSADFDGDGKTDLAVFRPSSGEWFVLKSTGGYTVKAFGQDGDRPVAADYDGDGKADVALWRPSSGNWMIFRSSDGQTNIVNFGLAGDLPSAADYDGDGKADIAVFRPSNGGWYQMLSTQGYSSQIFGLSGDRPTPNAFIP